jgi:hypothetical protein
MFLDLQYCSSNSPDLAMVLHIVLSVPNSRRKLTQPQLSELVAQDQQLEGESYFESSILISNVSYSEENSNEHVSCFL